jgi:hypothetical protein
MLHDFMLAGRRMRLWQRPGESYEHVLLKALGYTMFVAEFPHLEIEPRVDLRYRPDLVARTDARAARAAFAFWGECGLVTMRKVGWLLKHAGVERLALFKLIGKPAALVQELRATVDARYRADGRLLVINFVAGIAALTTSRQIAHVPQSWYTLTVV